ncbi:50S ribosomal protein L25 [Paenibacillus sp.]|uniref:50S ribosomal protein L25 n=1 Tax=Paenibacillus sp. TaxID=58172 RepID=UPI002D50A754|nr:50S ribosomal protein L25 [Paenibacillus sp.]HZG55806.1 50S ribosomal protein L25 [Paenibacillus sp.]
MLNDTLVSVLARAAETKSDRRTNRESGKIPGVVYGKKVAPESIYIEEKLLHTLIRSGAAAGAIVRLQVPNHGEQPVMIGEIQRDKVLGRILHVDFHQIDMNEPVKATVRVELTGDAQGVREGGILQVMNATVDVRCIASAIPAAIEADVSGLQVGEHLYVRDLRVPAGVEIRSDENDIVATVLAPQKELPEASDAIRDETVAEHTEERVEEAQAEQAQR